MEALVDRSPEEIPSAPPTLSGVLAEIAEIASQTLDLQEVFHRVANAVRQIVPFDHMGVVRILDGERAVVHATTICPERTADGRCVTERWEPIPLDGWSPRIRPRQGSMEPIADAHGRARPRVPDRRQDARRRRALHDVGAVRRRRPVRRRRLAGFHPAARLHPGAPRVAASDRRPRRFGGRAFAHLARRAAAPRATRSDRRAARSPDRRERPRRGLRAPLHRAQAHPAPRPDGLHRTGSRGRDAAGRRARRRERRRDAHPPDPAHPRGERGAGRLRDRARHSGRDQSRHRARASHPGHRTALVAAGAALDGRRGQGEPELLQARAGSLRPRGRRGGAPAGRANLARLLAAADRRGGADRRRGARARGAPGGHGRDAQPRAGGARAGQGRRRLGLVEGGPAPGRPGRAVGDHGI